MTSFLRNLLRGGHSKHKKLLEDYQSGRDSESESSLSPSSPMRETVDVALGVRIFVKYLGSTLMTVPKGDAATSEAIRTVIALAKAGGRKLPRVILYVTLRGIKVLDAISEEIMLDISIYRISYCSSDASYSRVFAFIASNANETMECHAFLCRKRKMARCATLAIAKTFNTAYELWQLSHTEPVDVPLPPKNMPPGGWTDDEDGEPCGIAGCTRKVRCYTGVPGPSENTTLLIDFSDDCPPGHNYTWVSFDDDDDDDDFETVPRNIPAAEPENQVDEAAGGETLQNSMDRLGLS